MIKVNKINWLSKDAREAQVFLSDGDFNIQCFSHPFNGDINDTISLPLYTLNAEEIFKLDAEEKFSLKTEKDSLNYMITGRLIDKVKCRVKIGDFIIELDNPIPGDIHIGDYISFICDRVDIY